jgi:hypothetical protein
MGMNTQDLIPVKMRPVLTNLATLTVVSDPQIAARTLDSLGVPCDLRVPYERNGAEMMIHIQLNLAQRIEYLRGQIYQQSRIFNLMKIVINNRRTYRVTRTYGRP